MLGTCLLLPASKDAGVVVQHEGGLYGSKAHSSAASISRSVRGAGAGGCWELRSLQTLI